MREVRIVGDDIEPMVVPTRQALDMARQQGVDLVEISPNAEPPVCRLISYSKFLYQQKKRQKELKEQTVLQYALICNDQVRALKPLRFLVA